LRYKRGGGECCVSFGRSWLGSVCRVSGGDAVRCDGGAHDPVDSHSTPIRKNNDDYYALPSTCSQYIIIITLTITIIIIIMIDNWWLFVRDCTIARILYYILGRTRDFSVAKTVKCYYNVCSGVRKIRVQVF
jgi:hypothetical protein